MCGIAGIMSLDGAPVFEREVRDMCRVIAHRGPDSDGFYVSPSAGLGMRRLSIIDVEGGSQPVHNEDGSVWVVFNGEIYNFKELTRDLESRGHRFAARCDTEVLVHLYEEYGAGCVRHLRGMFAFALWDTRNRRLLLARDRLGIKPLYYAEVDGRLLFGSEIKSILQLPQVNRTLNWGSVEHLFSFLTTPASESIVEGIHKLEPGHTLIATRGCVPVLNRYWTLTFEPDRGKSADSFVQQARSLIDESVRLHMVSDVPVGALLSGGIDSSAIVASASKAASRPIQTFSLGFREPEYNELDYARRVAALFETDHHELVLEPQGVDELERIAWFLDEPFGDSSAIPTYMVSKLVADNGVKVVLSGDGGDELFAGYERYRVERAERNRWNLPGPMRQLLGATGRMIPPGIRGRNYLRHRSLQGPDRYLDACTLFRHDDRAALFHPEFSAFLSSCNPSREKAAFLASDSRHWLSRLQHLDILNSLPLDILTKVDRMTMAHSIEARVPLLDHTLVEFAATIPQDMSLQGDTAKQVLKNAMRGILPDRIIDRPKRGFAVPLEYWFRGKLAGYARDVLLGARARQRGFFNTSAVADLLRQHEQGRNLDLQIWTLLSFELWSTRFLDQISDRRECAMA